MKCTYIFSNLDKTRWKVKCYYWGKLRKAKEHADKNMKYTLSHTTVVRMSDCLECYLDVEHEGNCPGGKWNIEDSKNQQHCDVCKHWVISQDDHSHSLEQRTQHTKSKYEKC